MKTALMIFAAVGVAFFDITTVVVTFCWICGAMNIGELQGTVLMIMWVFGIIITCLVGIGVSEEDY